MPVFQEEVLALHVHMCSCEHVVYPHFKMNGHKSEVHLHLENWVIALSGTDEAVWYTTLRIVGKKNKEIEALWPISGPCKPRESKLKSA